jgi:predicted acyl esterase
LQQQGRGSSVLIIGPWTHGSPEEQTSGDLDFGSEACAKVEVLFWCLISLTKMKNNSLFMTI